MEPVLLDGWGSVARMALLAGSAYVAMVLALRIFGKTALAQMTSYDLIVTVALGSVLATIPMSPDVSLVDGLVVVLGPVVRGLQRRLTDRQGGYGGDEGTAENRFLVSLHCRLLLSMGIPFPGVRRSGALC